MPEAATAARLAGVLDGFPRELLPRQAFERIARLTLDMDALGRLEPGTERPLVEPHTLRAALREALPAPLAGRLVELLAGLEGAAFLNEIHPPAREVSWHELAERVVIFDGEPDAAFGELRLSPHPTAADLVAAVQERFPSMEPELLQPDGLPPRILELLQDDGFDAAVHSIVRQLGWWAALAAVLLVPAAYLAAPGAPGEDAGLENAWPLWMVVAATAFGGWTLTVAGSCLLAPRD